VLKPTYKIRINNKEIRLYLIPNNNNASMLAIIGPPLIPKYSPEYYRDMVILQNYYDKYKIIILPNETLAEKLNIPIAGRVEFVGAKELASHIINLSDLLSRGYNYILYTPNEKTPLIKIMCTPNNKSIEINLLSPSLYPSYISYRASYLISINQLIKITKNYCNEFKVMNAEKIVVLKYYYINLSLRKYNPGSLLILHDSDIILNGRTSYIDLSRSPILYYLKKYSLITLYSVDTAKEDPLQWQYIVYSEGDKGGTTLHISHILENGRPFFGFLGHKWAGCTSTLATYSWTNVFAGKDNGSLYLYVNGVPSCEKYINETASRQVIYSRVGVSQPFQNTWFKGAISYIALYNRSVEPTEYLLSRLNVLSTQGLIYFIQPNFNASFDGSLIFHDIAYRESPMKTFIELRNFYNDSYIHLLVPKGRKVILEPDCVMIKSIQLSQGFIEYVIDVKGSDYMLSLTGDTIICTIYQDAH
jgi:hypothetical protein